MTADSLRWRDIVPSYLSVQDRDLRIVEVNDSFRRAFGNAIGEHCYQIYKRRDAPCPDCPVLKTFEDGMTHSSEETVITSDGKADMVVHASPILGADGAVKTVMETSTNITAIKRLQHELDRSKQHYSRLFDVVPCYISVQDRDLRIIESNLLFKKDFGDHTGGHCFRAYKGADGPCRRCLVLETFADGEVHSGEETVTTRDGQLANMIVYTTPVLDLDGQITSVMEVSTNITEVKRQHRLAMTGLAIAGMAHRVKNILMGLEGGTLMINAGFDTDDDSAIGEGWHMVERNVDKIGRIIKDLLYCSKERPAQLKPGIAPAEIVRDVYELYRARMVRENIDFTLDVDQTPWHGTFDPEGVHRLVVNLAANAIDACRFDTTARVKRHAITLRCRQGVVGEALITVSDNGAGIPDAIRDKVFNGFFSTKGTEGTGLGLLVVQKVVEEHGGCVTFSSREGEGTTFEVTLSATGASGVSATTGDAGDEQWARRS